MDTHVLTRAVEEEFSMFPVLNVYAHLVTGMESLVLSVQIPKFGVLQV